MRERGALGYVVATNFADGVVETLQARHGAPTIANISHIVSFWDPLKQKAALNALEYATGRRNCRSISVNAWINFWLKWLPPPGGRHRAHQDNRHRAGE